MSCDRDRQVQCIKYHEHRVDLVTEKSSKTCVNYAKTRGSAMAEGLRDSLSVEIL